MTAHKPPTVGDTVRFVSKFGDLVTGTFEGVETRPWGEGEKEVAVVLSDNTFGAGTAVKGVHCLVGVERLRRVKA